MVQSALGWNKNVLENVFRELYSQEVKGMPDYIPMMYSVENSNKAVESIEMIGGGGLMEEWSHSNKQVYYSDINELWQKYFTHEKFSAGRQIDRDFIDDLKLTAIKDRIKSLADEVYHTRQRQGAQWFTNGTRTGGAVDFRGRVYNAALPDGKALFATDHPFFPGDTSPGQSNLIAEPLTVDAVDEAMTLMQSWRNDQGNLIPVIGDTLIVAPKNRRRAMQIAGIPGRGEGYEPGSANHDINVFQGDLKVIVNPFLNFGNSDMWVLADSRRMKRAMKWFDRRKPENGSIEEFDSEIAKHKVVGRWSFGCIDYTWAIGSVPTP